MRVNGFIPPRKDRLLHGAVRRALPFVLHHACHLTRVDITPEDLARLQSMRNERVMLTPNHPTTVEPAVMYYLSCATDMWFNTLAARENFNTWHGAWGRIIQGLGAYSIVRGTPDRESFRCTRELLSRPGAKLVVFPEGEVYTQNDSLIPFRQGVVQLAFWAMEDVAKSGESGTVCLLPIGIKYVFTDDMRPAIERALSRCEGQLCLRPSAGDETYIRLRRIAVAALSTMESVYGIKGRWADQKADAEDENLTPRIIALKEALLARAASTLAVKLDESDPVHDRLRALWNALNTVTHEAPGDPTPYGRRLLHERAERARPILRDLNRLYTWLAVYDGYVRDDPSPERMMDTLRRMERELCGKPTGRGNRIARVRIGDSIDLGEYWAGYRDDRKETVQKVTAVLEEAVGALIRSPAPSVVASAA